MPSVLYLIVRIDTATREFVVYQNSSTPPTTTSIVTQINLCDALPIPDEPKNDEICQKGTVKYIARHIYISCNTDIYIYI
jgi:hypothetical protein